MAQSTNSSAEPPGSGNKLLDRILELQPSLADDAKHVKPRSGERLIEEGSRLDHVYFPITGAVSVLVRLESGVTSEVTSIGNEGFAGAAVCLGVRRSAHEVMQQTTGLSRRLNARALVQAMEQNPGLRRLLNCYIAYLLRFAYQSSVCGARHDLEQRACRWLLHTADSAPNDALALSQSTLADLLGVRRPSVTEVLQRLRDRGSIATRYRSLEVLDRDALYGCACECYRTMREYYEEVMGDSAA